jgi:phage protein D
MLLKVVWFPQMKMLPNEEAMPMLDEMTINERRKYVKLMASRYQKASRKQRSELLTEMEKVTKLHRKHLTRLLNGKSLERKKRHTPAVTRMDEKSSA